MRKVIRYASVALVLGGLGMGFAQAQSNKTSGAPLNLTWEELGPNNLGSHARALTVDASGNVWAGALGGGLWKSTNGGSTWVQVTGLSDNLNASCIAIDGSNIYVGTGETFFQKYSTLNTPSMWPDTLGIGRSTHGFANYAGLPGEGVFVSNDGGSTWSNSNFFQPGTSPFLSNFSSIQKVTSSGGRTFVATLDGLYYSDNANLSSATKSNGTRKFRNYPITDVVVLSGGVVLAATADSVYRSTDNGASFGIGMTNIPVDPSYGGGKLAGDRIVFAVAPSDPTRVYVTGAAGTNGNCTGVFVSDNSGQTWVRVAPYEAGTFTPFGGNGRYSMVLSVDPSDKFSFLIGGRRLYRYAPATGITDAASSVFFPGFIDNYVPYPMLSIAYSPLNNATLFIGTDKEIVRSTDNSETYALKSKEFNAAHMSSVYASPSYAIWGYEKNWGLVYKDNGVGGQMLQQWGKIYDDSRGSIRGSQSQFTHYIAQGTDLGLIRSLNGGTSWETFYGPPILPAHPSMGADSFYIDRQDTTKAGGGVYDGGGPPQTPWCLDEYIPAGSLSDEALIQATPVYLYMASRHFVWVCTNPFGTLDSLPLWNRITNNLINNAANPKEFFTAIAAAPDGSHTVYVATNYGKIYRILDANDPLNMDVATKVSLVSDVAMPSRWITALAFDPNDANTLVITYAGYESDGLDKVYVTNNAMDEVNPVDFRSIGQSVPDSLPVYAAAIHPYTHAMLIGTEKGVYSTTDDWTNSGASIVWNKEDGPFGNAIVNDIYIRPYYLINIDATNYKYGKEGSVFICTNGRGAYRSNSIVSIDNPASVEVSTKMELFPNPAAEDATIRLTLPMASKVSMNVYGVDGRLVSQILDRELPAGNFEWMLETSQLKAGVYFINASFESAQGSYTKTLKAVVVK